MELHLVAGDGSVRSTGHFSAGWGDFPFFVDARMGEVGRYGVPLLEVSSGGPRGTYALLGERFALVRVEHYSLRSSRYELEKNRYDAPNLRVGPHPGHCRAEWLRLLRSDRDVEVLEALTWLAGVHLNPKLPAPERLHEDPAEAKLWHEFLTDERVKGRIAELTSSADPWVRETALLATEIEVCPRD